MKNNSDSHVIRRRKGVIYIIKMAVTKSQFSSVCSLSFFCVYFVSKRLWYEKPVTQTFRLAISVDARLGQTHGKIMAFAKGVIRWVIRFLSSTDLYP